MGSTCTCFESNDNKQNMETNMFQNNISKNKYILFTFIINTIDNIVKTNRP